MANILLDPDLWIDDQGNVPPIFWTGDAYEILVDSTAGVSLTSATVMWQMNPASAGDTIAFDYEVDAFIVYHEVPCRLVVKDSSTDAVMFSADVGSLPMSGHALVECEEGASYFIRFERDDGFANVLYDLSAIITPTGDIPPPEPVDCEEHGRTTRAYVSGYQRDRVHRSRLVRGEKRCLVANFNGAIPAGRTIVSATWRCDQNQALLMSDAGITDAGRCTKVMIVAQVGDGSRVKCQVTLDNGEVYNQLFYVRVFTSPWFMGENTSFSQGPTELTATA